MVPFTVTCGPGEGLLLNLVVEVSDSPFFCSAVKTEDSAATAAARCDPRLGRDGLGAVVLVLEDGLNADDNAARADAL